MVNGYAAYIKTLEGYVYMKEAKIIIGANFGDEGKGQMTEYFAWNAKNEGKSVIVVKHNGGAQAGHTVIHNGKRYVFSHFGSGTAIDIPTYLTEDFIVNPILFRKEYELLKKNGITPYVYINKNAVFTTPYEMIINQVVEEARGSAKHGSCGIGIFETVKRAEKFKTVLKEIHTSADVKRILHIIAENWLHERLMQHGIYEMEPWITVDVEKMLPMYIQDFQFMFSHARLVDSDFFESYETVIFETAQGLLLDQNNREYFPHLTPSNTGSTNPSKYLSGYNVEKELVYVTRTYLTRHGAGMFKTECRKEDINPDMYDETNVPNRFQDVLRYGYMDLRSLDKRIEKDRENIPDARVSIAAMHLNETNGCFAEKDNKVIVTEHPFVRYTSDGATKESINIVISHKQKTCSD